MVNKPATLIAARPRRRLDSAPPAWATVPYDVGGVALLTALFGLVWDVAYHIDHGRDVTLLNPPHLVILVGLAGLAAAAGLAVLLATLAGVGTGLRLGPVRVPFAAVPLGAMAAGALAGFPLDDLWHRTYGIDVTLWSATHLTMIGGAALATFTLPLFAAEAGLGGERLPRRRRIAVLGGLLLAMSVVQLEYDFGVPQWQALYEPLLIAIAAGLGLTAARAALGPGAAVWAALCFLLAWALLALAVGPGLGHTLPRFPLYLGCALVVELAFRLTAGRGPAAAALLAGALAGTAGLATEWGWNQLWRALPWSASLLPRLWVPALAAVLAAVVGTALGRVLARERPGLPGWSVVGSLLGLVILLAVPLPRGGAAATVSGRVTAAPAGAPRSTVDRFGLPAEEQDVRVDVTLTPAGAAAGADWFEVLAWQGGGRRAVPLVETAPGRYHAADPVPTGGSWKAMVYLARGSELVALPVSLPPDPAYGAQGVLLEPVRDGTFEPAQFVLTSEAHGGQPWVATAAYAALVSLWTLWVGLLLFAYRAVGARRSPAPDPAAARTASGGRTDAPRP